MDWLKSGFAASLPYIAALAGVLLGSAVLATTIRRAGSATRGRKLPIIGLLLMTSVTIASNYVESNAVVIAIMTIALFGQGMVNPCWTLISSRLRCAVMDLDHQLCRYFGTDDLGAVPPAALAAGLERMRVDLGLEQDRARRFRAVDPATHARGRAGSRRCVHGARRSGCRQEPDGAIRTADAQGVIGIPVWR